MKHTSITRICGMRKARVFIWKCVQLSSENVKKETERFALGENQTKWKEEKRKKKEKKCEDENKSSKSFKLCYLCSSGSSSIVLKCRLPM